MIEFRNAVEIEDNLIDCEVNHPEYGWLPTTLSVTDDFDNGIFSIPELYSHIVSTGNYVVMPQVEKGNRKSAVVRGMRDSKLTSKVDPIVSNPLRYGELAPEKQTELLVYRQALLKVPQQYGFPFNVTWPQEPTLD